MRHVHLSFCIVSATLLQCPCGRYEGWGGAHWFDKAFLFNLQLLGDVRECAASQLIRDGHAEVSDCIALLAPDDQLMWVVVLARAWLDVCGICTTFPR